jgi:hypothetical protein
MKFLRHGGVVLGLAIWFVAWPGATLRAETAAELIERARQYDCGYTAGPDASQTKAREIYQQALAADPDPQQHLHILFRLAQLHSSAYLARNGEKPDYPQAITYYERIIATYPAREPLVIRSMAALADCFITQRRFLDALPWSKKVLEVETQLWQEHLQALEAAEPRHADGTQGIPPADLHPLPHIEQMQRAAVDQVANAALGLGPPWMESQLRSLARRYPATVIEKRARELLDRHANAVADDLMPSQPLPPMSEMPVLQSAGPAGSPAPDSGQAGLGLSSVTGAPPAAGLAVGPGQTAGAPREESPSRSPRGPPRTPLRHVIACAAGLLLMVLIAQRLLRGSVRKGIRI